MTFSESFPYNIIKGVQNDLMDLKFEKKSRKSNKLYFYMDVRTYENMADSKLFFPLSEIKIFSTMPFSN